VVDILFTVFVASSIAIFGCLLFEAINQRFFKKGEAEWNVALGGAYLLAFTGVLAAIFAALGGSVS
jgi:hypothetical protein